MRTKASIGKTNKRKGSNAERHYVNYFKGLHKDFSFCITSRQGSRILDDCKVDLMNLPILLQIKAGKQRGMNPSAVLQEMDEMLVQKIPASDPMHKLPRAVIHRKEVGRGKRRNKYSEIVSMTLEDFTKLFLKAYGK